MMKFISLLTVVSLGFPALADGGVLGTWYYVLQGKQMTLEITSNSITVSRACSSDLVARASSAAEIQSDAIVIASTAADSKDMGEGAPPCFAKLTAGRVSMQLSENGENLILANGSIVATRSPR
jgi:hypothetical protein